MVQGNTDVRDVNRFRVLVIGLQLTFTRLRPIIQRTHLLSANAEIASARLGDDGDSFGIIAKELTFVIRELDRLIDEMERIFRRVAGLSAGWLKAEQRLLFFQRALGGMLDDGDRGRRALLATDGAVSTRLLRAGTAVAWERAARGAERGSNEQYLWEALREGRGELLANLTGLLELMRTVARNVDRLSWLAVRHSHFTAVTARVEAAKLSGAEADMMDVARAIRQLADDIAAAEHEARAQVLDAWSRSAAIARTMQRKSDTAREVSP